MKAELAELKATMLKANRTEKASIACENVPGDTDSDADSKNVIDSDFSYSVNHSSFQHLVSSDQVVDSGCTLHMTSTETDMEHLVADRTTINLADGSTITSVGRGIFQPGFFDGSTHSLVIVPQLTEPLLSVSKLADSGIVTVFNKTACTFYQKSVTGTPIGKAVRRGGLYYLPKGCFQSSTQKKANLTDHEDLLMMWHGRFNHPCIQTLKQKLCKAGVDVRILSEKGVRECQVCIQGKMRRRNFHSQKEYQSKTMFSVIHSDVSKYPSLGRDGSKYFVSFINDYTKFTRSFPLCHKSETLNCFKKFKSEVESLPSVKIAELRSENGGKYIGDDFLEFCASHGIHQTMGPPIPLNLMESWSNGTTPSKRRLDVQLLNPVFRTPSGHMLYHMRRRHTIIFLLAQMPLLFLLCL